MDFTFEIHEDSHNGKFIKTVQGKDSSEVWEKARATAQELGRSVIAYDNSDGSSFRFLSNGSVQTIFGGH